MATARNTETVTNAVFGFGKDAVGRIGVGVIRSLVLRVGVLVLLAASYAIAATHPVPLDPKADTDTCLQCHEDKSKGKTVHPAVQMGCLTCHELRVSKDATRIKLKTTTVSALCITCHSDKNAAEIKGKVHPPAVRDCAKCHDPHVSENKSLLRKTESGDKKDNLCLTCHTKGLDVPKDGSRHAALDMGCDACHTTHKTGERGKREFDFHLTKDAPALCLDCHDAKDASLAKAHQGQPFATANCLACHDPHQSKSPKLMQAFLHAPFESKSCDTCHKEAKDGKVVLTAASAKEICVTCHAEKADQINNAKVQHPGAMGDCTDCHNPHGGKDPAFPNPGPVAVCVGCHTDQADQGKKAVVHQPAFEQGCATCHEPHGNDTPKLLRAEAINSLCLECHGPDAQPKHLESDHLVTIFNDKVKLPEDYFASVKVLPIKYGRGHPVENHPISDVVDPSDITKVTAKINCLTCHQPHASAHEGLLAKDQQNNMAFCDNCHKNRTMLK